MASLDPNSNRVARPYASLLAGTLVALIALVVYGRDSIVAEDFALPGTAQRGHEELNGLRYTAASPAEMKATVDQLRGRQSAALLWLGNSQLHTINQFSRDDHLSPYWLRKALEPRDILPLGFSLPNANLQEQLIISRYVSSRTPVRLVVVQLVFDDLREDGLRSELKILITPEVQARTERTSFGREMLGRLERSDPKKASADGKALDGFVQAGLENDLVRFLSDISPLWARRPDLRAHVLTDLYEARNAVFGITPMTVRRMIPIRYERNMRAMEALFADAAEDRVSVIAYIAPLRPDVPAPYDPAAYRAWKAEVGKLAEQFSVRLLDLDNLVPGSEWGTHAGNNVDFMHFMGSGHILVAQALQRPVSELLGRH